MYKYHRILWAALFVFLLLLGACDSNSNNDSGSNSNTDSETVGGIPADVAYIKSQLDFLTLCSGDALCVDYVEIWLYEFLSRNSMSGKYFLDHISIQDAYIVSWNSGETIRIKFDVNIDWAVISNQDSIIVYVNSSDSSYSYLNIPRDVYLSQTEISLVLDFTAFQSEISPTISLDTLSYSDANEALMALQNEANAGVMEVNKLSYYVPGIIPHEDGYPYMIGSGVINTTLNQCMNGHLNLVTGDVVVFYRPCIILDIWGQSKNSFLF